MSTKAAHKHTSLISDERGVREMKKALIPIVIAAIAPGYRENPTTDMDFRVNKEARKMAKKAIKAVLDTLAERLPNGNHRPNFEAGERVELVSGGYGGRPTELRPGVVKSIDTELVRVRYLRVKFDDGEERRINPDVMRHIREVSET